MNDPATVWTALLDTYAAQLDEIEAALAAGLPQALPPLPPPADLPPPPAVLHQRATDLLQRGQALQDRLVAARDAVADELCRPARRPSQLTPRRPSMLDTHA